MVQRKTPKGSDKRKALTWTRESGAGLDAGGDHPVRWGGPGRENRSGGRGEHGELGFRRRSTLQVSWT